MGLGRTVLRFLVLGAVSALVVAFGARLVDEILGLRPREGRATYRKIGSAEETAGADWSEQIELDQTVLPGISIRS
jgi:hypothetical protein